MRATKEGLKQWVEFSLKDGAEFDGEAKGVYGLIWFLKYPSNVSPRGLALKTVAPESLDAECTSKDIDYLRREFRIWLDLPNHLNVVPAFGFDVALLERETGDQVRIPVMRMKRMDGSLEAWVTDRSFSESDRLIAIAQALNGLKHLYRHGLEGHGDLKPGNLLYSDLSKDFVLTDGEGWPSKSHPWNVRVADFGWADAWVDLGFNTKAFRQYLAPERLTGTVVPEKSDIFAIGVMLAEFLLRRHPARNLKKATKSEGEWKKCVENSNWDLQAITSERIRNLVSQCLHAKPEERPTAQDCLEIICAELKDRHDLDIKGTLELWGKLDEEKSRYAKNADGAWAATKALGLGADQESIALQKLEERLAGIKVDSIESCEAWFELAKAVLRYYRGKGSHASPEKATEVQKQAKNIIETILANAKHSDVEVLPDQYSGSVVRLFERFAYLIKNMAKVAELSDDRLSNPEAFGEFFRGALAFARAAETRNNDGSQISLDASKFLGEAIDLVPTEAIPYYFRALWKKQNWHVNSFLRSKQGESELTIPDSLRTEMISDLEQAIKLEPDWKEAIELLEHLNSKDQ